MYFNGFKLARISELLATSPQIQRKNVFSLTNCPRLQSRPSPQFSPSRKSDGIRQEIAKINAGKGYDLPKRNTYDYGIFRSNAQNKKAL